MITRESLRLTFTYEGKKVTLKSASHLQMRAPAGERSPEKGLDQDVSGKWIEIRDAKGKPLYRRSINNLLTGDVEVHTGDPNRPMKRVPAPSSRGIFHLVIPFVDAGRTVTLFEQRVTAEKGRKTRTAKVTELISIDLNKINFTRQDRKAGG